MNHTTFLSSVKLPSKTERVRRRAAGYRPMSSAPTLPRLPVPDLHQTLERYLKSLEPLLLEEAAHDGSAFTEARHIRETWAEDFQRGLGKVCQDRLLALDRASQTNWLDDNFWMKKAYLEWRAPLIINSNWWLALHNDPNIPKDVVMGLRPPLGPTDITDWQVRRAAWLVHRTMKWKARLERSDHLHLACMGERCSWLPVFSFHVPINFKGIWLRDTAAKMFNISRMPQLSCDALSPSPSPVEPGARKLLVLLHGWFYAIEVMDETTHIHSPAEIERRLLAVVADVSARLERRGTATPIGVLTADDRDQWTENLRHLLSLSKENHRTLDKINCSLFALSLDHYTHVLHPASASSAHPHPHSLPEPNTLPELTAHLHNVRSGPTERPAHNRWFDKPYTLIVENNTRAGVLGEHSPCDALVPSIGAEYAVVQGIEEQVFPPLPEHPELIEAQTVSGWERLEWVVDDKVKEECMKAEARVRAVVEDSDDGLLWFEEYGTDWIKNEARLSPDAYIQMAMQLAWYRSRGCFTATYETALTRLFKNGRTETIRTLSADSRAFVLAMADPDSTAQTQHALLRRAIQTHTNLTRQAMTGRGIDRHLLGLRMMLDTAAGERHTLFEDTLFTCSQEWKLSTSGLSEAYQFRGTGFGASYPDGYGINYLAAPNIIKFGIESKFSSPLTSTEELKTAIALALHDMRDICLSAPFSHL